MTRAELDAVIAARRAKLVQARKGPKASPPASPAAAPRPAAAPPAPARKPAPNPRPPSHYLKGPPEPYESFVGPGGEISPTPFGTWWGPI
jgi:hypothetical protein